MNTKQLTPEVEKATHTAGPWRVGEMCGGCIDIEADATPRHITVGRVHVFDRSQEAEANARLIAAAPDLLACLRRMCGMYGAYSQRLAPLLAEDEGTIWTFERANSLALEAVAKAEGRS